MDLTRQLPPQSIEAEMSILGAIFVEGAAISTAHEIITVDDLYRQSHRAIYEAMAALDDRSEPIDLITVSSEMRKRQTLEECGGMAYLATLVDYVPMAANIAHYCRIVKQKAAERRLILHATEAVKTVYDGGSMDEAVSKLESAIQPNEHQTGAPVKMDRTMREAVERIEARMERKGIQGISYGLAELDRVTSGMHPGELIIIAGRPSMGKSAFAGNIAASICDDGKTALFFTLEMSRHDIADRMLAGGHVKYQNIRSGRLEGADWARMSEKAGKMLEWNMHIDDTPAIPLREVRSKAKRLARAGLDLVVIDYLQLMAMSDPRMSRVQGVGEISRGLKQLARELGIPVIVLSQLNRSVDGRNDKRPAMSDLRDSGEIEQDADVILFPYRPAAYCDKCKDKIDDGEHNFKEHQAKAEIIIEKQRAGERNISVPAQWIGEYQMFTDLDPCPY